MPVKYMSTLLNVVWVQCAVLFLKFVAGNNFGQVVFPSRLLLFKLDCIQDPKCIYLFKKELLGFLSRKLCVVWSLL